MAELQRTGDSLARAFSRPADPLRRAVARGDREGRRYEDALFHVRRQKEQGAISVKSYNYLGRDQRQQVLKAARELGHDRGARRRHAPGAEPDPDRRWPYRHRAQPVDQAHYRHRTALEPDRRGLLADVRRRLRRADGRGVLVRQHRGLEERASDDVHAEVRRLPAFDSASSAHPRRTTTTSSLPKKRQGAQRSWRAGRDRCARPAGRSGRALGVLDDGAGGIHARSRRSGARPSTARAISAWTPRSARSRPASSPTSWSSTAIRWTTSGKARTWSTPCSTAV